MDEWIVSVGKHKGVIPGAMWVSVQKLLELNKSKSYRKPRSNVALLSGILVCGECGDYMRPKMTDRLTATGEPIYTYMCAIKERSRGHVCDIKNANGNMLDAKMVDALMKIGRNSEDMARQITQTKKTIQGNREGYDAEIAKIKGQIEEHENSIKALVVSLAKQAGTSTEQYIVQQIDELHNTIEGLKQRLKELEAITQKHELADIQFDIIRQLLSTFSENLADYSVEQKRAAIRTFVKRIVWDGENAHLYLFNDDGDCEYPTPPDGSTNPNGDSPDSESPLGEHSKCHTIIAALNQKYRGNHAPFVEKWHPVHSIGENMMLMARHTPKVVIYAPLYIHSFRLVQPHTLVEAEKFNIRYTDPSQSSNTADKLRWYRYRKGLLQKDMADYLGMDRSTYSSYEDAGRDYYPIERMKKITELFCFPVEMLLDEYNLFLYHGQGQQIKEKRKARNMTQAEYARHLGVPLGNLKSWERDRVQIFKSTWQKIMQNG